MVSSEWDQATLSGRWAGLCLPLRSLQPTPRVGPAPRDDCPGLLAADVIMLQAGGIKTRYMCLAQGARVEEVKTEGVSCCDLTRQEQIWWLVLLIPALGKLRQEDCY